jgi:probable HAF family extracellular repeat protein
VINYSRASSTSLGGINNEGQLVGSYTASGVTHGFLDSNGVFTAIDVPGSADTTPIGINDGGDIVGSFDYPDSLFREGFVAAPAPEPATVFLLVGGVVAIAIAFSRRSKSIRIARGTGPG